MADGASAEHAAPVDTAELPPPAVPEAPSTTLSDMARLPLPAMPVAAPMATPVPVAAPALDTAIPVADMGACEVHRCP